MSDWLDRVAEDHAAAHAKDAKIERLQRDNDDLTRQVANLQDKPLAAQNKRLAKSATALVRQLERIGGYSKPDDQADLREARAVLAECA